MYLLCLSRFLWPGPEKVGLGWRRVGFTDGRFRRSSRSGPTTFKTAKTVCVILQIKQFDIYVPVVLLIDVKLVCQFEFLTVHTIFSRPIVYSSDDEEEVWPKAPSAAKHKSGSSNGRLPQAPSPLPQPPSQLPQPPSQLPHTSTRAHLSDDSKMQPPAIHYALPRTPCMYKMFIFWYYSLWTYY